MRGVYETTIEELGLSGDQWIDVNIHYETTPEERQTREYPGAPAECIICGVECVGVWDRSNPNDCAGLKLDPDEPLTSLLNDMMFDYVMKREAEYIEHIWEDIKDKEEYYDA